MSALAVSTEHPAHVRPRAMARFRLEGRSSGVLLHPTSLPGPHGNGDLGAGARAFVDFLARAGQTWWQMLPVNPAGMGASPYSGVSVFAGNPLLINLDLLVEEGLLEQTEVSETLADGPVDYPAATRLRTRALRMAFARFRERADEYGDELAEFRAGARFWLDDYTTFMALAEHTGTTRWTTWPRRLKRRRPSALLTARTELSEHVAYFEFEQWLFERQWRALRLYAAQRGVGLIGDAPIFVAHESADVWAHQGSFRLSARGEPTHVSGVPPDYFSTTGQRWGTPLYRWKALERDGYAFWIERLRTLMERFDVIRLDHFIGFARYWEIAAHEPTAVNGRWMKGPGRRLFDAAQRELGALPFIAEDLGCVTDKVRRLRDRYAFPGMRVFLFAFGAQDMRDNEFAPHCYVPRSVAYTGTHDTDTSVGFALDPGGAHGPRSKEQAERERVRLRTYLLGPFAKELPSDLHWHVLRAVFASAAGTAIVPMQDVLGLGTDARMNTPGRAEGNWRWRLAADALSPELADALRATTEIHGRCAPRE